MYGHDPRRQSDMSMLGERVDYHHRGSDTGRRSVFLEGLEFHKKQPSPNQVAPAPPGDPYPNYHHQPSLPVKAFEPSSNHGVIFETLKPIILLLRAMGLFPIDAPNPGKYAVTMPFLAYSLGFFILIMGYTGYIKWDNVEIVRSQEGKFEEAVIDYLFSVYLVPVMIVPTAIYEARKVAAVYSDWCVFEGIYRRITDKNLPLFLGNKPLMVAIVLPILGIGTMIVTHVTMVNFRFLQVKSVIICIFTEQIVTLINFPEFLYLVHIHIFKYYFFR